MIEVTGKSGPQTRCSVSGRVVDTDDHGIAGIDVTAWATVVLNDGTSVDYYNTAVTAADGTYKVPDLVAAKYTVSLGDTQQRYITRDAYRDVDVAADETGVDFVLARGGGITGHARDEDGQPVVDAEVSLNTATSGYYSEDWTQTGADGVYNFVNLPVSSYDVHFTDSGVGAHHDMLLESQTSNSAQVIAGETVAGPDATFIEGGFIAGTIVDGNNGTPVSDVDVYVTPDGSVSGYGPGVVSGYNTYPDWSTGRFELLVKPGSYAVQTYDWNGVYDSTTVSGYGGSVLVGGGDRVDLGPVGLFSSRTDVHYISGRVTDSQSGDPLAGQELDVYGWSNWTGDWNSWNWFGRSVSTGSDGRYACLVPGANEELFNGWTYEIYAYGWPDHQSDGASAQMNDSDIVQDFALDPISIAHGSISGHITDSAGDALPGVQVHAETVSGYGSISGYLGWGETDENGDYKIDGLPTSDNVKVVVNSFDGPDDDNPYADRPMVAYLDHPFFPGFDTVSGYTASESVSGYDPVNVEDGDTTTGIDQSLPLSGHLRCTANSADGPMGGVKVSLEYKYKGTWTPIGSGGFTAAGVLDVPSLWPGDYRISYADIFGRVDGSGDLREVHISEGATSTVALISPSATTSVPLPGGASVGASFAGAITSDGVLSVEPTTSVPALPAGVFQIAGSTYEVSFSGSFDGVWTLTFPYDPAVPDALASSIVVNHYNSSTSAWETLTPISVDTTHHTITIETASLSPFALTLPLSVVHTAQFTAPTASEAAPFVGASVSIDTTLTDANTSDALPGRSDVYLAASTDGGSTWTTGSAPAVSMGGGKYRASFIATQTSPVSYRFGVASALPYFTGAHSTNVVVTAQPTNTSWIGATLPGAASSVVVEYGASTTMSGSLVTSGGALATAGDVVIQTSTDGVGFVDTSVAASKVATGSYSASIAPAVNTYYRFHFKGDGGYNPSYSAAVFVSPKVKLTTPYVKSNAKRNKAFSVSGKVYPAHRAGAKTVKVYYERLKGKKWIKVGYAWAKNTSKGAYSIYSASFKLKAGTYRFRAAAPADTSHAATSYTAYSGKVKVK